MQPYRLASVTAIGEVAAKTSLPKPKAVSTAQNAKPVNSGGASTHHLIYMDEWVLKWRNQLDKKTETALRGRLSYG